MKRSLSAPLLIMKAQIAAVCILLAIIPQAYAQLTVCNEGQGAVMFSFSHSERMKDGHYRNLGWFHIEAGKCDTLPGWAQCSTFDCRGVTTIVQRYE